MGKLTDFAIAGCNAIEAQAQHLLDNYKGLLQETESIAAITAEGVEVKFAQKAENVVLKDAGNSSKKINSSMPSSIREKVLPKMETYEQARNKALEIIGEVDVHSGKPYLGRIGVGKGKIVGRNWHDNKVILRIDYDPTKGPHINITDFRNGKGTLGTVVAIPFNGNEETVKVLLNHLQ